MINNTTKTKRLYVDESIFQGWMEFEVEGNVWVRAERLSANIYAVYIRHAGASAFAPAATVRAERPTPASVWAAYVDVLANEVRDRAD